MTDHPLSGAATESPGLSRRVWRGLDSPLRLRIYLLIAASALAILLAVDAVSERSAERVQALGAREFQARTASAAERVAGRLSTVQAGIHAVDGLVASGIDLDRACDVLSRDPGRPFQRLYVFSVGGNIRCTTVPDARDQPEVIRQRPYFQGALATGSDQVGGPLVSVFAGRPSVAVAHPVTTGAMVLGVIVAGIEAPDLVESTHNQAHESHRERAILVGADGGRFELGVDGPAVLPHAVEAQVRHVLAGGGPCAVLVVDGFAWACHPVGRSGLVLVDAHPESDVFAAHRSALDAERYLLGGVVVIALLSACAADFLFARRIRLAYGNAGLSGLGVRSTTRADEIDALGDWARAAEASVRALREEVGEHERRRQTSERDLLTSIAEAVEVRYPFLRNHGDRVGGYARQIGTRLGVQGGDLEHLEFAARVHDLGKIAVPDAIYLKPGALDPIEAAQMQLHAPRGSELATRMRTIPPRVADAIRHHHERWDGRGYPDGLAGTAIPFWSRIIAVADAYDAMTEERPYRQRPLTHEETVHVLLDGAGTQWDTTAVHAFMEVLEMGLARPKSGPAAGVPDGAGSAGADRLVQ